MDATTPPPGIPPLIPDDPALIAALGGRMVPMKVGRPTPATAAPVPGPAPATLAPAINLSGTFTGTAAIDPTVRAAIADARALLNAIVTAIAAADATLPALLDLIHRHQAPALAVENFDPSEAAEFFQDVTSALQKRLTPSSSTDH